MKVEKYDLVTANLLMKICDDIYRAESLSNTTDPELKKQAMTCIKKIMSGSATDITNTFTFSSPTI